MKPNPNPPLKRRGIARLFEGQSWTDSPRLLRKHRTHRRKANRAARRARARNRRTA